MRGGRQGPDTFHSVARVTREKLHEIVQNIYRIGALYQPKYDLKTGLQETIQWYKQNNYTK